MRSETGGWHYASPNTVPGALQRGLGLIDVGSAQHPEGDRERVLVVGARWLDALETVAGEDRGVGVAAVDAAVEGGSRRR